MKPLLLCIFILIIVFIFIISFLYAALLREMEKVRQAGEPLMHYWAIFDGPHSSVKISKVDQKTVQIEGITTNYAIGHQTQSNGSFAKSDQKYTSKIEPLRQTLATVQNEVTDKRNFSIQISLYGNKNLIYSYGLHCKMGGLEWGIKEDSNQLSLKIKASVDNMKIDDSIKKIYEGENEPEKVLLSFAEKTKEFERGVIWIDGEVSDNINHRKASNKISKSSFMPSFECEEERERMLAALDAARDMVADGVDSRSDDDNFSYFMSVFEEKFGDKYSGNEYLENVLRNYVRKITHLKYIREINNYALSRKISSAACYSQR